MVSCIRSQEQWQSLKQALCRQRSSLLSRLMRKAVFWAVKSNIFRKTGRQIGQLLQRKPRSFWLMIKLLQSWAAGHLLAVKRCCLYSSNIMVSSTIQPSMKGWNSLLTLFIQGRKQLSRLLRVLIGLRKPKALNHSICWVQIISGHAPQTKLHVNILKNWALRLWAKNTIHSGIRSLTQSLIRSV